MKVTAKLNYLRISPRKTRLLADMIRGKQAKKARADLSFNIKRGAEPMLKLLNSAIANAKNDFELDEDTLVISKITVDEGPKLKRWRARSRGRAYQIQKKTSHISIELEGKKMEIKKKAKTDKKAEVKQASAEQEQEKKDLVQETEEQVSTEPVKKQARTKSEIFSKSKQKQKGFKRIFRRKAF